MSLSPPSDARSVEFARLFNLFELLVSRRPRVNTNTDLDRSTVDIDNIHGATEDDSLQSLPMPEELGPVIKNLTAIVNGRSSKPVFRSSLPGSRPRRNTVASSSRKASGMSTASEDSEGESSGGEDDVSLAKFPLSDERKYPFTFKHMVHKLYRKDDWVRTIKEMLEKSKNEFKPLAEQEMVIATESAQEEEDQDINSATRMGMVRFSLASPGVGRRGTVARPGMRQRSQSVVNIGGRLQATPSSSSSVTSPGSGAISESRNIRALKKRCVGRRRSLSGPLNGDPSIETDATAPGKAGKGGSWVYASTVSSAEAPDHTIYTTTFPPGQPPSPTQSSFSTLSYPLLRSGRANLPSALRGSGAAAAIKRRDSAGNALPNLPFQTLANTPEGRIAARKRAMTAKALTMEEDLKATKPSKRPFSG